MTYQKPIYTGKQKKGYLLQVGDYYFDFKRKPPWETFDTTTNLKQLYLTENFKLPIFYGSSTDYEYQTGEFVYTEKEAREKVESHLSILLKSLEEKGVQISENHVKINIQKMSAQPAAHYKLLTFDCSDPATWDRLAVLPDEDVITIVYRTASTAMYLAKEHPEQMKELLSKIMDVIVWLLKKQGKKLPQTFFRSKQKGILTLMSNICEEKIELPAEHERNVFGQFDEHMKKIEKTLGVTVISRDGQLRILGPMAACQQAVKIIREFLTLSQKGNTITQQNVNYALPILLWQWQSPHLKMMR